MQGRWMFRPLFAAALCVLMLGPVACGRGEAPGSTAQAPAATGSQPAQVPDQSVAERERAVAEREARVAAREAELARRDDLPAPTAGAPRRARIAPTAVPEAAAIPTAPPAPTAPPTIEVEVPVGTVLSVEFDSPIASNTVAAGAPFGAKIAEDVVVGEVVAIPAGTAVRGTVVEAVPAKKIGGQARLSLSFDQLELPSGETVPVSAAFAEATKSQTGKDAATIGGAAAGGAILGRLLDKRHKTKGTVLGAIVGGAIGTAIAAKSPGEEVQIPAGSVVEIRLTQPVRVVASDT